ncbi:hypothetical protein H9657_02685 [Cellulomonas sp. Sa3CUA2]|uniref:Bulb-type lectin domain-containing protein n=1 Tax=Cellulomonas avistercoris TaxID=2762242 RepID=A0ABR8Q9T2_9CELL|nr:hypothetical protein [Cellulomonas avistercoris]MBD7917183.1 hypothetical protein [Cellulomonas avistercoris]
MATARLRGSDRAAVAAAVVTAAVAVLVATPAHAGTPAGAGTGAPALVGSGVEPVHLDVLGHSAAAHRVSGSGVVVGDAHLDGGGLRAFRWESGEAALLPGSDDDSNAVDVNDGGQVLAQTYRDDGSAGAVLWHADGRVVDLAPAPASAYAWDLDESGRVALNVSDPSSWSTHAAVWQDGTLTLLDDGGAASYVGEAGALNERGDVAGTVVADDGSHAVVWRDGAATRLPTPDGAQSFAEGLNERGDVLGSVQQDAVMRAVVWERGRLRYLVPDAVERQVFHDLNERGVAAGAVGNDRETMRAALADRRGVAALPTLGGPTGTAYAVNDRGVAVGSATTGPDTAYGQAVAWVRGRAVPLSAQVDGVEPVNSAALDVDERGRAVGYVQLRDPDGSVSFTMRAVLWEVPAGS